MTLPERKRPARPLGKAKGTAQQGARRAVEETSADDTAEKKPKTKKGKKS